MQPNVGHFGRRWEPWAGFGFAVLYFFGMAALPNTPDDKASDSKWLAFYAADGHRATLILSAFVLVLAGLCLLSFVTGIWTRVRSTRPEALNPLPVAAAAVSAACIGLAGVINATVAGAMVFGDGPEPPASVLRFSSDMSFPMAAVGGMIAAALAVATLSAQARRAGIFGSRLAIFSYVMAVISLASFVWIPQAAMLLWCIVVGVALLRQPETDGGAVPTADDQQLVRIADTR